VPMRDARTGNAKTSSGTSLARRWPVAHGGQLHLSGGLPTRGRQADGARS